MNDVDKFTARLNRKQKELAVETVEKILRSDIEDLNVKKLKGAGNLYRVRKGRLRFIYETTEDSKFRIIEVTWRDDNTYKF